MYICNYRDINFFFTFDKIFKPLSIPIPLKDCELDLLALSKEDLKINGIFTSVQISFILPAIE